jgi:phenylacetate-CoA ligase
MNNQNLVDALKPLKPHIDRLGSWRVDSACQQASTLIALDYSRASENESSLLTESTVRRKQLKRLSSLADYAFEFIPFYRELYRGSGFKKGEIQSFSDFQCLPCIRKKDLRNLQESLGDGRKLGEYRSRTSGSTGNPLILINDFDRTRHWFVERLRMFERMLQRNLEPNE